jgi:transcriptional antiterminator RfaH
MDPKWYLVKTKPLNEPRIYTRLTEAGFETLYPKILKKVKGKGRFDIRPFFPTYLFVKFAIEQLRTVRYTRGVARVVSFGLEPQEVGPEIVDAVRARMDDSGIVTLVKPPVEWKPGEKIKIGDGPFAGLDAIFVEALPDRERVVLLLDAVSSFRVILKKDALEE